jgi:hypothetical protein
MRVYILLILNSYELVKLITKASWKQGAFLHLLKNTTYEY